MVNPGRVACIFTPFVLTLASLACVVILILAGSKTKNAGLGDLFFAKIDTSQLSFPQLNDAAKATGANLTSLNGALLKAKQSLNMSDFYTIYLRGYCKWNGGDVYAFCSEPTTTTPFFFDPIKEWGLNGTGYDTAALLPAEFQTGLAAYKKGSTAMYYLFAAALAFDAATVLVGITAIFSRWGSLFTTIFADIATLMNIGAALTATVMFPILSGALNKQLDAYSVKTTIGTRGLALAWIAVAFAMAAGMFWTFSVCCCSGRSPYKGYREPRGTKAEKTPYTYERVGSPYLGPRNEQSVPLNNFNINVSSGPSQSGPQRDNTAYEPFRSHA